MTWKNHQKIICMNKLYAILSLTNAFKKIADFLSITTVIGGAVIKHLTNT